MDGETEALVLNAAQSRRMAELFDRQARGSMLPTEQKELEALVASYGQKLHEQRLQEFARNRGISLDEARAESAKLLDEAQRWWQTFEADPTKRREPASRRRRRVRRAPA